MEKQTCHLGVTSPLNPACFSGGDAVRTVEDFKRWIKTSVRPILPHGSLICGLGHLHAGGVSLDCLITIDFPVEHIDTIRNGAGAIDTPILRRWLATQQPVYFDADHPWPDTPAVWLESFRRYGLRNVLAHAMYDRDRCLGTYHSLYRIPRTPDAQYIDTLRSLVPILHEMLCRVIGTHPAGPRFSMHFSALTERERDVIRWLRFGKTNGEIAHLTRMSESTVKHHLTRIYQKLGVETRSQLVRHLAEFESSQLPGRTTKVL